MASEKYVNLAASTLNGNINDVTTTVVVTSGSSFPSSGDFRILIDSEIMLVTARTTETLTVTRNVEGTSAASHTTGAAVTHVVTAASLERIVRANTTVADVIANRPSAGDVGRLFIPTNGLSVHRDTGTIWTPYGPIHAFTQPPALASFTGVNTTGGSTAVAADQGGIISVTKPPQNGVNITMYVKTAPSPPYTITAAFTALLSQTSFVSAFGLCFRQSSNGNIPETLSIEHSNVALVGRFNYTSLTARGGSTRNSNDMALWWLRIEDDNTNRKHWLSLDGFTWSLLYTIARTTTITADQVGFFIDHQSGTTAADAQIKLLSWAEA